MAATQALRLKAEIAAQVPPAAMILAAGLGKRMRPLTASRPKPLIEVAGKTLLDHILERLRHAGVEQVVVNVHYLADAVEAHLAKKPHGLQVRISDERRLLLETGGGLVKAAPLIDADPFLVVNSDNLWLDGPADTLRLLASHWVEENMDALLLLVPHAQGGKPSRPWRLSHGSVGPASPPRAKPRRTVRLHGDSNRLEAVVGSRARGTILRELAVGQGNRNRPLFRRSPPGAVVRRRHPAGDQVDRAPSRGCLRAESSCAGALSSRSPPPVVRRFACGGPVVTSWPRPLTLASGRILLPNNRAVRSITDAFVRASGSGLVLPRLIPIGDPELEERVGGALDPAHSGTSVPPAVEPLQRLLALAELVRSDRETAVEAMRMAAELGRTLDALLVEGIDPHRLADAAGDAPDLAGHWQVSLDRLRTILEQWPERLRELGRVDLAERRNRLLHGLAERWASAPPDGFTVAAGITTAAPAVAAVLKRVAVMPAGRSSCPGSLSSRPCRTRMGVARRLGRAGKKRIPNTTSSCYSIGSGISRDEVRLWPRVGRAASSPQRTRAIANAFASARFSDKWIELKPGERRLSGIQVVELPDSACEAQAIALAIREALETPARTAALVTPDRTLARRVSALLARWGIEADDSAGKPLKDLAAGTFLLGIASAIAEELAPVPAACASQASARRRRGRGASQMDG
jgi:GTP:adenosylcobinamide-phosphate guanylyltransferase